MQISRKRKMNDIFGHIEVAPYGRKSTSGKGQGVMLFGAVDLDAKRERRRRNVGKGRNEIDYGSQGSVWLVERSFPCTVHKNRVEELCKSKRQNHEECNNGYSCLRVIASIEEGLAPTERNFYIRAEHANHQG
jgi:hypothetical protein